MSLLLFVLTLLFLFNKINCTSKLWVRENIGEVNNWYYNKQGSKAYVSTKQGTIACIDLENNGDIIWRQIFDENDIINQFEMSLDNKSLMSLSNGNILRKWNKIDGSLIWESKQFENNKQNNKKNTNMQIIENNKIILFDNFNILSVYEEDEGTLIWKKK
eukprot:270510_1